MQAPKPYREERPWGEFVEFTRNSPSTVKLITVNPGQSLSLQTHRNRDEFWRVISGSGSIRIGDSDIPVQAGDDHFVPRTVAHRIHASSSSSLVVLEIAFGHADESDIVRIEDKYGRST